MTSNLTIWDKFADIDPSFTKAITGKAYKGTSPNPQYVIKCLRSARSPQITLKKTALYKLLYIM